MARKKEINKPKQHIETADSPSSQVSSPSFFTTYNKEIAGLFILSFLVYANTLLHDFTIDDAIVINSNTFTKQGFGGLYNLFIKDTFYGFFGEAKSLVAGGRYRPLTLAIFAILFQFFGEHPFVFHLVSVLTFACLVVGIFIFIKRLPIAHSYWLALCTALLFAVHPIHTEAVANIKGLDEIMCMALGVLSLIFTQQYMQSTKQKYLLYSLLCVFLSILSKENGMAFVLLNILYIYCFGNKNYASLLSISSIGNVAVAGIYMIIRVSVIGLQKGYNQTEILNNPFAYATPSERMGTILYTWLKYVQLLIYPHPLTHDYYFNQIPYKAFTHPLSLLSLLLFLGLIIVGVLYLTRKHVVGYFIVFYLATFVLVSNLIFPIGTTMGERFIFIPSFAFCFLVVYFLFHFIPQKIALYSIISVSVLFAVLTFQRNKAWKDNFTLFLTDIKISTNSAKLNNACGGETLTQMVKKNPNNIDKNDIAQAKQYLNKAIEIHPKYTNAWLLLGNAYYFEKDYTNAEKCYLQCLKLWPDNKDAVTNLSRLYYTLGSYYGKTKNDLPNAIQYFKKSLKYGNNSSRDAYLDLGVAYGMSQQIDSALIVLKQANVLFPKDKVIQQNLFVTYMNLGKKEEAEKLKLQMK